MPIVARPLQCVVRWGRRPGVGDRAPLPGRPAAYRLPPTTGTSAAPLRPPALPALVGTMPRRPPAARATEQLIERQIRRDIQYRWILRHNTVCLSTPDRRPFEAERQVSAAPGGGSGADAGRRRLQTLVRRCLYVTCLVAGVS